MVMMQFTAILAAIDGKNNWDSPHYNEKSPENSLHYWKWPEFSLLPATTLHQALRAILGSADQEWAIKLAINIE